MKRIGLLLPSLILLSGLVSCSNGNKNIIDYINEEGKTIESISLKKDGSTDSFLNHSYDVQELTVYKFCVIDDQTKIIYTTSNYSVDEYTEFYVDCKFDESESVRSYYCSYVGEAGKVKSYTTMKLYEKSNFLEITKYNNVNMTLSEQDYKTYQMQSEYLYEKNEKRDVISVESGFRVNNSNLSNKFTYYIDLNYFDSYSYSKALSSDETIEKQITKVVRKEKISSTYFARIKDMNFNYLLGGIHNHLYLSEYKLDSNPDILKFIPTDYYVRYPKTLTINNESYTFYKYSNEIELEVNPVFDYSSNILIYTECNYRNYLAKEDEFNGFENQGIIEFSVDDIQHKIDSVNPLSYIARDLVDGCNVFINVTK